jgi:DNA-binding Lrp family transcriptional regulator
MPKSKEYSEDFRHLIIQHHLLGKSLGEIAEIVRISKSTVQYIVDKYKKTKTIKTKLGRGRKRKISHTVDQIIINKIIKTISFRIIISALSNKENKNCILFKIVRINFAYKTCFFFQRFNSYSTPARPMTLVFIV